MLIKELTNKYVSKGLNLNNARNLAAEEILLTRIASSSLSDSITLKGGIVMYRISKNDRRVTQDIDFDFIRYSIDKKSIELFVDKLNENDDFLFEINGNIEALHQEDYRGVRVNLIIKDQTNAQLRIKLDIGVHTYTAIEQEKVLFSFERTDKEIMLKVNPCEQIFAEKVLSLARLGVLSTRYKDIYDIYYIISNNMLNVETVRKTLNLYFDNAKRKPKNIYELQDSISYVLSDANYSREASKPAFKWIDAEYSSVAKTIIDYINKL